MDAGTNSCLHCGYDGDTVTESLLGMKHLIPESNFDSVQKISTDGDDLAAPTLTPPSQVYQLTPQEAFFSKAELAQSSDPTGYVTCARCGGVRPAGILHCSVCGHGRVPASLRCPKCSNPMVLGNPVCAKCGFAFDVKKETPTSGKVWGLLFAMVGVPGGCCGGVLILGVGEGQALGILGIVAFVFLLVMAVRSGKL